MNIQQLKYVVAVANSGSFREAAKKLFITQPSLSNRIRELENEIKLTLFTRTNRGVYLTEDGKDFLLGAEKLIEQMEAFEGRYQLAENADVFSVASQHYDFLGSVISRLLKDSEGKVKKYRIYETTTAKVIEDVQNFYSELGIIYLNEHNRSGIKRYLEQAELDYRHLGDFQIHIFLRNNHPLANQQEIFLGELAGFPQVRFTQDGSNFAYFSEDLIEIPEQETVIYTSDRGTLINILVETDAYASGSGIVSGAAKDSLKLIPLSDQFLNSLYVIHARRRTLSELAEKFLAELKKYLELNRLR